MLTDPMALFVALASITAMVYVLSAAKGLSLVFKYAPPVVWMYFVPMLLSTAGLLPTDSDVYSNLAEFALPFALILLTVSTDLKAIASLGVPSVLVLLAGSIGTAMGCIIAFFVFAAVLPDQAWQSLTLLSATWIGGSANLLAMQQSLNVDASMVGPIVLADAVLAYSWLGILIAFSVHQAGLNRLLHGNTELLDTVEKSLRSEDIEPSPVTVQSMSILLGAALAGAYLAHVFGGLIPPLGSPTIMSATTWTILICVSVGLLLSPTGIGKAARKHSASQFAYVALFLLLTTVGAQADLRAITTSPVFLAVGLMVLGIQILTLTIACRLLQLPAFFLAVGSMANIGGAVSGPIAAAAYRPALTPVGALLGVAGYIVGIYMPLGVALILSRFSE